MVILFIVVAAVLAELLLAVGVGRLLAGAADATSAAMAKRIADPGMPAVTVPVSQLV